jgi:hypothetical protein
MKERYLVKRCDTYPDIRDKKRGYEIEISSKNKRNEEKIENCFITRASYPDEM